MSDRIVELFIKNGTEKILSVITPFIINDPNKVYYIHKGKINLSSAKFQNDTLTGRLYNFTNFIQGEFFFGFNQYGENSLVFQADAEEDSIVYELPLTLLKDELKSNKKSEKEFIKHLETWVIKLYDAIYEDTTILIPPIQKNLASKGVAKIEEDSTISTSNDLIWFETDRIDNFLFNGHIKIAPHAHIFFPVTKRSFIKADAPVKVTLKKTASIIGDESFWDSLSLLHRLVLESDLYEAHQYQTLSENWLKRKYERIQKEFSSSFSKAHSVLTAPHQNELEDRTGLTENNLFQACKLVASNSKIVLIQPPNIHNSKDPIDEICRYSSIRYREIILEGEWYKGQSSGSFLGFLNDTNNPIALIPKKDYYIAFDVKHNTSFKVTKKNCALINKISYSFYRPLPKKKLTISDLYKFSFNQDINDVKRLILTGILTTVLALILPILTAVLFDEIIPNSQRSQLLHITYALLMAALGGIFFEIAKNITILRIKGFVDSNLQVALWDRLLDLPTDFFRKYTAGDLAERSLGVSCMLNLFSSVTINSIVSGLFSLINFILLFYYSKILGSIALLLSIVLLLIMFILGRKQVKLQNQVLDAEGKLSGLILQLLTGISVLKATGNEMKAFVQWFNKYIKSKQLSFEVIKIQNYQRIITSSFYLIALIIIYYSTIEMLSGDLTTGKFLSFNAAFGAFIFAMIDLSNSILVALKTVPIYNRMKPILDELPENSGVKEAPHQLKGEVELNNIVFRYNQNSPYILKNVSLRINKGEFIALVGPSGSGKSTIVRLLLGFNQAEMGTILYDGQDLSNIDVKLLRRQIGVVLQDGSLIAGDIFSNIVGSAINLTLKDAWEAAKAAAFDKDVESMPMGMFTIVNDEGGTLSGGQKQRLMIARSLVHKPKILIFDEATSALDNRTQAIVTESLDNLQVTRIVVAHRLSTIINADRIFYLENGEIIEEGNFQELMSLKGKFFNLAQRQIE